MFFLSHQKALWKSGAQKSMRNCMPKPQDGFRIQTHKRNIFLFHWDLFSMRSHCSLAKAETMLCPEEFQAVSLKGTFSVCGHLNLLPVLSCLATGYRRILFSKSCKSSRLWDQDMYSFNQPPSTFPSAFDSFSSCPCWWFSSWSLDLLICPSC